MVTSRKDQLVLKSIPDLHSDSPAFHFAVKQRETWWHIEATFYQFNSLTIYTTDQTEADHGEKIFFLLTNQKDVVLVVDPLHLPLPVLFISPGGWVQWAHTIARQLFTGRNVKMRNFTGDWTKMKDVQLGHVYRTLGRMTRYRKSVFVSSLSPQSRYL